MRTVRVHLYFIKTSKCFSFSQVAIKSIRKEKIKDEQDMVHIRREIEIMSSLRHPHIISIYEGICLCVNLSVPIVNLLE